MKIENEFGNKIGGSKRDQWKTRGLMIEDLVEMNSAEIDKYVKKDNIFKKPDYQKMVDEGTDKIVVYFIKLVRDALPKEPFYLRSNTEEQNKLATETYIKFISDFRDNLLKIKNLTDIQAFFKLFVKENYFTGEGYNLKTNLDVIMLMTNKLLITCQTSYYKLQREVERKQFCYTDEEKLLSNFKILKYDDSIEFKKDYSNSIQMCYKISNGTYFFYPQGDYAKQENYKSDTYFILDSRNRFLKYNLDTFESAKKYILEHYKLKEKEKTTSRRSAFKYMQFTDLKRIGEKVRTSNVKTDDYLKDFNFYGGEFGNWLNDDERQQSLNYGYEAFKDLAITLNIEDTDISLNNKLSIAFGSRGSGNALAHYEPLRQVINLTKMKGAGALSHEFGHALDFILLKENKKDFSKEYNDLMLSFEKNEDGTKTDFYTNSRKFDTMFSKNDKGYWSSECEMFARAFACYIYDKMKLNGCRNDYLNGYCNSIKYVDENNNTIYGYPVGDERKRINDKFDILINKCKELGLLHNRTEKQKIKETKKEIDINFDSFEQMTLDDLLNSFMTNNVNNENVDIER